MPAKLDYLAFDVDNHYYEAEDAFSRHIDPKMRKRGVRWCEIDGKRRILIGGKLDKFIPNPTFNPVSKPGALEDYFRGENPSGKDMGELFGDLEPIRPEYRDRDKRLQTLDAQGLEACVLFPTLGCGIEEALRGDAAAAHATFRAFNQWLAEDWGFAYRDRIFAVPMLTLMDPERAVADLEWVLERGARMVFLRPAPVPKVGGSASPGDPVHDPFWARVSEAGVTVAFHAGDSGYGRYAGHWERRGQMEGFRGYAFGISTLLGRAIMDTMAALIVHGVFQRFPNLRVASVENGGFWVAWLFKNLKKAYGQMPWAFSEDPRETFKRHIWVAPYFEDDIGELARLIGVDRILFGSDWPHAEGLTEPLRFVDELKDFSPTEIRKIMLENPRTIVRPRPPSAA